MVALGSLSYCICRLNYNGQNCENYQQVDYRNVACFPSTTQVETIDKRVIQISDLKQGDYIKSYDLTTNEWKYSKFILYLHKDENIITKYIFIRTSSNQTLYISKYHLIARNNSNNIEFVFANQLKINDNLIIGSNFNDNVIELKEIYEEGAYAPLLESGTISVNNILASCYANIKWHHLAHFVLQPIIKLSNYFDFEDDKSSNKYYENARHINTCFANLKNISLCK